MSVVQNYPVLPVYYLFDFHNVHQKRPIISQQLSFVVIHYRRIIIETVNINIVLILVNIPSILKPQLSVVV